MLRTKDAGGGGKSSNQSIMRDGKLQNHNDVQHNDESHVRVLGACQRNVRDGKVSLFMYTSCCCISGLFREPISCP